LIPLKKGDFERFLPPFLRGVGGIYDDFGFVPEMCVHRPKIIDGALLATFKS
jgi:hypothetical protein